MSPDTIKDPRAVKVKRALLSVYDKEGIEDFARTLHKHGVEILSTGGTAATLEKAGIPVVNISDYTGFPEVMDGRVKTLHPKIHAGILARRNKDEDAKALQDNEIGEVDLVVINLYPFVESMMGGADFETCIEHIDIGGPAMIRAAAKNHDYVAVVTDPQDYAEVLEDMKTHQGAITHKLCKRLAATAFSLTATYDTSVAGWMVTQMDESFGFPRRISFSGSLKQELRYGENPHQKAALYRIDDIDRPGATQAKQLQGKELSYNNLNDTNTAFETVAMFEEPSAVIVKHANPCGVATASTPQEAFRKALACDPVSAYGGIVALNKRLDAKTAEIISKIFVEVIIAPDVESGALDILAKKKKTRVLTTGGLPDLHQKRRGVIRIAGGLLVQDIDISRVKEEDLKVVTDREPTEQELKDMLFAFYVAKHVKSNAIVYARDGATVGIGAGQMSRVDSARIAVLKAREAAEKQGLDEPLTKGSVVASDGFFPFADGLITAADAGVTAVIQPGGSIRDEEVIEAANERGLAMVFTGMRHFLH